MLFYNIAKWIKHFVSFSYSLKNPEETTNGISSMTTEGRKPRKHMRGNRLLIEVGDAVYGIDGIKHRLQASQK